jgi:uncharacterized protein YndB with AHSA1/START domain
MTRDTSVFSPSFRALLAAALVAAWAVAGLARADGRPGTVEWSDGRKETGAISLTPGKDLRLFTDTRQVSLKLEQVKEISFKTEKEEMWEGFYFPNAGQATQVKTGEVYPIRYLKTQITLNDGKVVEGHLYTTTVYIETDDATEKAVLMAKQTGQNGQKLTDLVYPTDIRFDAGGAVTGSAQIDLSQAGFVGTKPPVIMALPDLTFLMNEQTPGKPVWTVESADPAQLLFVIEAADGIHAAWPATPADPERQQAVDAALKVMRDFYDTRTAVGSFANGDAGDIYSLVMMKRLGPSVDPNGDAVSRQIVPWSLVLLRWKYDPDEKKATLLNRVLLVQGRAQGNSPLPTVFKQPELLQDISAVK